MENALQFPIHPRQLSIHIILSVSYWPNVHFHIFNFRIRRIT